MRYKILLLTTLVFFMISYTRAEVFITPTDYDSKVELNNGLTLYIKKSYISKLIDVEIDELNSTTIQINLTLNQTFLNEIKNCMRLNDSIEKWNCFMNLKNKYFPDVDLITLINNLKELAKFPLRRLTNGIEIDRASLNLSEGRASFLVHFKNLTIQKWKAGFGSITFITSDLYPPDYAQTIDTTPDFKFKATSTTDSTFSCTLFIDDLPYGDVSASNDTLTTITANDTLSDGDHTWYINCTDSDGTYQSEVRTIGIGSSFSRCAVLIDSGTYHLTADIMDSSSYKCVDIRANDITLDCQGYMIDGDDTSSAGYGIYVYRSSAQITNITIENCIVRDWYYYNIYFYYADNNYINDTITEYGKYGVRFKYSDNNQIVNLTARYNGNGLDLYGCVGNRIINSTLVENTYGDFGMVATSTSHCNNYLENVTGSNNLPIWYYNYS